MTLSYHDPHFSAQHFIDYNCAQRQISPSDFGIRPDVVISYVGDFANQITHWELKPATVRHSRRQVFYNERLTLIPGPVGAPQAAIILEELKYLGAQRIWVLGYAGSLTPLFPLGTLVGVHRAYCDEGTSPHYGKYGWGISSQALAQCLSQRSHLAWGEIWTTDAIYRETPVKIRYFTNLGCQLVDMETSCYFHVGQTLGLDVSALMVVSDELYHAWRPGFGLPSVVTGVESAYQLLSEALQLPPSYSENSS